jgi:protein phosphatase
MNLSVPEVSLIALVGPSGSGKSTFAKKHFKPTEVISSDFCRGLVSDDENSLTASGDAFDVLYYIAGKRLAAGKLTVIDATNVQVEDRRKLLRVVREHDYLATAIVFDIPESVCQERNKSRADREFGPHVIRRQRSAMRRSLKSLKREGFRHVYTLSSEEEVDTAVIERNRLWTDRKDELGPFDIIGDIHGCFDELQQLLQKLGYTVSGTDVIPPEGRRVVFLGDLVDRGPRSPDVLELVMKMVKSGDAICVPGNHDVKLVKKLNGRNVKLTHGLADTMEQLKSRSAEFIEEARSFIDGLISHAVLDRGKLVVAHAGMQESYQGRASGRVRSFALFGETDGESDEFGLPIRYDWAAEYRGDATVVYGHTPVPEPVWINRTLNIDTGCVFGGKLTALRYPESEIVQIDARKVYSEPVRPLEKVGDKRGDGRGDRLNINDVSGKRVIHTSLRGNITIREEQSIAALEVMSRFAIDPRWLIYLPPTMSPPETSDRDDVLEHPAEAFAYYAKRSVDTVVCEEKHMGSRAIVIVCKDADAALRRFKVRSENAGVCYTRTGRPFFDDGDLEKRFLAQIREAMTDSGFWEKFDTDWACLDCELMPWSAKAQVLLKEQYATVGCAGSIALSESVSILEVGMERGLPVSELLEKTKRRVDYVNQYRSAYREYCWPVQELSDLKLAPFHILATEGCVHFDKDHVWHMKNVASICEAELTAYGGDAILRLTNYLTVDLGESDSIRRAVEWWETMTDGGGEGMVVKPFDFTPKDSKGIFQPAVKCRGKEYLRIIYGPEYSDPAQLARLRSRSVRKKRALAAKEFSLGHESLQRFVNHDGFSRVHECVFGVLAFESEPVDPRL